MTPTYSFRIQVISTELGRLERVGLDGQFKYIELGEGKIQITRYIGDDTDVVIPAVYDGYDVYSVGNPDSGITMETRYNIFGETNSITNSTITSLTISEGIEVIETAAFARSSKIAGTLTLPNTLKKIGYAAFDRCTSLTGDLVIPNSVVEISDSAFQACSGLKGNITLSNSLEFIGTNAFYNCQFVGDLTIPDSVKTIEKAAFSGCKKFNGILKLSNNLEVIGDHAFNHNLGFTNTTLDIPASVKRIGNINGNGTHIFYDFATKTITDYTINNDANGVSDKFKVINGTLMTADSTRFIAYPASKVGNTYEIPEGIRIIDELSFSRAGAAESNVPDTGLKKLILPNSLELTTAMPSNYLNKGNNLAVGLYKYIGVNEIAVKEDNPNYKTVDGILYSKDGTTLWYVPFAKTGDITIENGVTTIKSGAFYAASSRKNITSVIIPASVTTIESSELTELKSLGSNKVTFAEGSIFEFNSSGKIVKKTS